MKIIHQKGYSRDELKAWRSIVHKNLIDSAKDLVISAHKLKRKFTETKNEEVFCVSKKKQKKKRRKTYERERERKEKNS